MARWIGARGTSATDRFVYNSVAEDFPVRLMGGGGIDTVRIVLTAAEWRSSALQAEMVHLQTFLDTAHRDARGQIHGTFTSKILNLQLVDIERLQLVVGGRSIDLVNDAPIRARPLADRAINEDSAFGFQLPANSFSDGDDVVLSYTARLANGAALPSWLKFNPQTQAFSGRPTHDFNGKLDIKVTASDGEFAASDTFRFTVKPVNDAPVLSHPIAHQSIIEDDPWIFTLPANTFTDVDSRLTISATNLEPWMDYDPATRTFSGTPPDGGPGPHPASIVTIPVYATDGQFTVMDLLLVQVRADF